MLHFFERSLDFFYPPGVFLIAPIFFQFLLKFFHSSAVHLILALRFFLKLALTLLQPAALLL